MVMFTTVQKVNDLLGKKGDNDSDYYIVSGGTIDPSAVEGWITRRSGIVNEEHTRNYQQTTVTDEFIDGSGLPFLNTDYYPIISVSSLKVYDGAEYDAKTEGDDRDNDDFYIDKPKSGLIKFWSKAPYGLRMIKITYDYGYATADMPSYVEEVTTKMVAVDAVLRQEFQETCKDLYPKFLSLAKLWIEDYTNLLNKRIRKKKLVSRSLGTYHNYSALVDLGGMTW